MGVPRPLLPPSVSPPTAPAPRLAAMHHYADSADQETMQLRRAALPCRRPSPSPARLSSQAETRHLRLSVIANDASAEGVRCERQEADDADDPDVRGQSA